MIREIWLTDAENKDRFNFSSFGDFIFTSPTNLGIYRNKNFLVVNNQQIEVEDIPSFKNITGTIIIKGLNSELETKYAQLRDFISKHIKTGFRLYLKVRENVSARYINCAIDSLDKTEKSTANTMLIPINIIPKSLWLGDVEGTSITQSANINGIFRFAEQNNGEYGARFIERPLNDEYGNTIYSIAFASGSISQAFIFNSGEETTPLIIRVYGKAVNPYIKLKDYNTGEILQSVKFNNLTVADDSYLEINSEPDRTYIEVVNITTGNRTDVESYVDESTNIYMNLPIGSYIIEASDDISSNVVQTRVFFTNQYKGA